jgi:hypothetical protein
MRKRYDLRYENGRCPFGYEYVEGYSRDGITVHGYCRKINSMKARGEAQHYEKLDNERAEERQDFWSQFGNL